MKGYMVTFFTQQDRRHGMHPLHDWLLAEARKLGIRGGTVLVAAEGYGRAGRRHSAHFFELTDQPVEVQIAATEAQLAQLFKILRAEQLALFYVKSDVEFGSTDEADTAP